MDSAEWQFEQGDTEVQKLSKCASAEIPEIDVRSERAIYYVDPHGAVAWANDAFARFAEANGAPELMRNVVGAHLLGSFSGVHRARWQGIYEQLSKGRMPGHVERFHCPSPTERREYLLRIVPVRVDDKVFLRHETTLLAEPATEPTFEGIERSEGGYSEKAFRFAIGVRPLGAESGDGAWARDLGDGRVALMIADAMGHGAAAVAALRDFFAIVDADPLEHPTQAIVRANERFLARPARTPESLLFLTGLLMVVDSTRATMDVVSFGHHGFIFTPSGPIEVAGGIPVGIMEDYADWPAVSLDLEMLGWRIVAYTDGIAEQFGPSGEMYGLKRVARDIAATAEMPLASSLSTVFRNLDRWRGTRW